ncbi:glycosyltransferase [Microlunatus panaciterrae]|uniref:Cellulose synthase/poly-beta-1,6-N-acetylglucosamine synthase-like glycosyltransferase n=1 Tax=Microlunatus panaciterrae TaxID=400768 RepID=A0ABS2RJU8_9ACTN|nr:glycosyltransferase [Microlunatus panaciterrae]MBM7798466.1 cellulose synthase/poly-beta-1,6-N-acetylglucosamine synthase-like glycosyltransferase [Microlunatus panaciterrae]
MVQVLLAWLFVAYFVFANGFQTLLLSCAWVEMVRHRRAIWAARGQRLLTSSATPRVSVLAPAYNEAATVAASVRSLLTLSYPNLEVVVINDGSSDATLALLQEEFDLQAVHPAFGGKISTQPVLGLYRSRRHRSLVVVDKVNGGKADSLNAGLNVASGSLICAIDADTLIEPDAFLRLVRPFIADEDTVAAGATIHVVNGSVVSNGRVVQHRAARKILPGIQTMEYLRSFLFGRLGWNRLGGNLIISGAFGMFRRDAVLGTGGYRHDTVGEDMELVVRLRRRGLETSGPAKVVFVPDPIAWTEVPESARTLGRQRDRWQRGLADVMWRHRGMIGNPRYGRLGLVAAPYFLVVELFGPVLQVVGVAGLVLSMFLGALNWQFAALFLLLSYGWGVVLTGSALVMHQWSSEEPFETRDLPRLLAFCLAENLGYRQLNVLWQIKGMWRYLRGRKDWGTMVRVGFEAGKPSG